MIQRIISKHQTNLSSSCIISEYQETIELYSSTETPSPENFGEIKRQDISDDQLDQLKSHSLYSTPDLLEVVPYWIIALCECPMPKARKFFSILQNNIMNKLINLYIFGISYGYTDIKTYTTIAMDQYIESRKYYVRFLSRSRFQRLVSFKSW